MRENGECLIKERRKSQDRLLLYLIAGLFAPFKASAGISSEICLGGLSRNNVGRLICTADRFLNCGCAIPWLDANLVKA